ncbi:MAG: DUF1015 domain-containing protein, partial [Clostridia bacterium]|nr:DUF1015 domain-containing protein [Clostridia bacterium]
IPLAMQAYDKGVFATLPLGYVYTERTQADGRTRCGIVGIIDLEDYEYEPNTNAPIRATEGTVKERIPPRVEIRRSAIYELPHVMLLLDDAENSLLRPYQDGTGLTPLYDFPLMLEGGHLKGWLVPESEEDRIKDVFSHFSSEMKLAVGDGNHSLAAAKSLYEELKAKSPETAKTSPLRYALVEVVNIHSPALDFEPIYRLVKTDDPFAFAKQLYAYAELCETDSHFAQNPTQTVWLSYEMGECEITFGHGSHFLAVGTVQQFLDAHPEYEIDYIHGEDSLLALSHQKGRVGIRFDGMKKEDLFLAVVSSGVLPRKAFSMGHAKDKRYYMEARKLSDERR